MQPLDPDDPSRVGAYRLLRRLGAGGMGRVYLGRSPGGRTVAVKVVHPHLAADEGFRARFRREVDAARRVGGRWTAPVLDADPEAALPWVASGYVAGPALHRAVGAHGPLPERTVRALGVGLGEALTTVHAQGLVHRDVKPSNVLLGGNGPRLIDFGIVRAADATDSLTATGATVGSPGYMSPEQVLSREVGPASDVFSLGAVLVYAATGTGPFPGDDSAALLYKVVHEEPELAGLGGDMAELCAACLAKDPADRPTAEDLVRRLAGERETAASLTPDWLPGPVLAEANRSAAELLDLEVEEAASPPPPATATTGDGPTPPPTSPRTAPSGPSGPDSAAPSAPGTGDVPTWRLAPPPAAGVPRPPDRGHEAPTTGPGFPEPRLDTPPDSGADEAGDGEPTTGSGRRLALRAGGTVGGRRLSCTVVLAVAGALVGATTLGVVLDVLPGFRDPGSSSSDDHVGQPPGGDTSSDGAQPRDRVPRALVGSFTGEITASGLAAGTVTVKVTPGRRGEDVVRFRYVAPLDQRCSSVGRLREVDGLRITVTERPDPEAGTDSPVCTGATATVVLSLDTERRLRYRSFDDRAGRPSGTLDRVG